jgi:hypothetical protein
MQASSAIKRQKSKAKAASASPSPQKEKLESEPTAASPVILPASVHESNDPIATSDVKQERTIFNLVLTSIFLPIIVARFAFHTCAAMVKPKLNTVSQKYEKGMKMLKETDPNAMKAVAIKEVKSRVQRFEPVVAKVRDPVFKYAEQVYGTINQKASPVVEIVKKIVNFWLGVLHFCLNTVSYFWNLAVNIVAQVRQFVRRVVSTSRGFLNEIVKPSVSGLIKTGRTRVTELYNKAYTIYAQTFIATLVKKTLSHAHTVIEFVQKQCTVVLQRLLVLVERVKTRGSKEATQAKTSALSVLQSLPFLRGIKAD